MFKNFNFLLTLRSQTSFLCLCSYHFNQYPSSPQEGVTLDFKCQRWPNGGKNQNGKKSLGLHIKPKNAWAKTAKFPSHKNFQKASNNITITNLQIGLNTEKNPYLNQAAKKNILEKILKSKISNLPTPPKKSFNHPCYLKSGVPAWAVAWGRCYTLAFFPVSTAVISNRLLQLNQPAIPSLKTIQT